MKYFLSIVFLIIWITFFTGFNDLYLTNSDYVRYGGESEAFLMGIVQTLLYGVGFLPLFFVWKNHNKIKNTNKKIVSKEVEILSKDNSIKTKEIKSEKEKVSVEYAREILSQHYNLSVEQIDKLLMGKKIITRFNTPQKEIDNFIKKYDFNLKDDEVKHDINIQHNKNKKSTRIIINVYLRDEPKKTYPITDLLIDFDKSEITVEPEHVIPKTKHFENFEELTKIIIEEVG